MLEGKHRTADKRLAELVAEIRSAVGGFDENIERGLVQPGTFLDRFLPGTTGFAAGVGSHVHRRSSQRQRALSTGQTVADLAAATGSCPVERLDGGGKVVRFGLDRDDGFDVRNGILRGLVPALGGELFDGGPGEESDVVLVGRDDIVVLLLGGAFDQFEERKVFLLPVDDEFAVEDLVAAMFGVDLGKTEYLAVGERTAEFFGQAFEVGDLLLGKSQAFLLVVRADVLDLDDVLGPARSGEEELVQTVILLIEHRVENLHPVFLDELLDALDPGDAHVLADLHRIGTPRGDHLLAGTDIAAGIIGLKHLMRLTEQPREAFERFVGKVFVGFHHVHHVGGRFEERKHAFIGVF